MQAAPETGHHTVPDALRDEALAQFFADKVDTAPTTGGVNNVCQVRRAYSNPRGSSASLQQIDWERCPASRSYQAA